MKKIIVSVLPDCFSLDKLILAFPGFFQEPILIGIWQYCKCKQQRLFLKNFSVKLKRDDFSIRMGEQGPGFVGIRFCQVCSTFSICFLASLNVKSEPIEVD